MIKQLKFLLKQLTYLNYHYTSHHLFLFSYSQFLQPCSHLSFYLDSFTIHSTGSSFLLFSHSSCLLPSIIYHLYFQLRLMS